MTMMIIVVLMVLTMMLVMTMTVVKMVKTTVMMGVMLRTIMTVTVVRMVMMVVLMMGMTKITVRRRKMVTMVMVRMVRILVLVKVVGHLSYWVLTALLHLLPTLRIASSSSLLCSFSCCLSIATFLSTDLLLKNKKESKIDLRFLLLLASFSQQNSPME